MSTISVTCGQESRYKNIFNSLALIKNEIGGSISNKKNIVIKVNFVRTSAPLAATHPEAVKSALDFLYQHFATLREKQITIAEAPYEKEAEDGFKNYDYYNVLKGYNVRFLNLNGDKTRAVEIKDEKFNLNLRVNIAETILKSDFIVTVGPPKTHDIHKNHAFTHAVIAKITEIIKPNLNIIDGWEGMEGKGPSAGKAVDLKTAISGLDAVAVDSVGAYLMGFEPQEIGYLALCKQAGLGANDLSEIKIVGVGNLDKHRKYFQPHPNYKKQLAENKKILEILKIKQ